MRSRAHGASRHTGCARHGNGVRAAEDGHLTHLAAHAALRRMGAWHVKSVCCWLLLLPPTQCVHMTQQVQEVQEPCIGTVVYLQDRAL
jgi:hypothetical protein